MGVLFFVLLVSCCQRLQRSSILKTTIEKYKIVPTDKITFGALLTTTPCLTSINGSGTEKAINNKKTTNAKVPVPERETLSITRRSNLRERRYASRMKVSILAINLDYILNTINLKALGS